MNQSNKKPPTNKKERRKRGLIQKAIDKLIIAILSLFVSSLPYTPLPILRFLSVIVFIVLYPTVATVTGMRRRFIKNITMTYMEEINQREARRIARRSIYNLLIGIFELGYYYHHKNRKKLLKNLTVEGHENLLKARQGGKGAVGVGAHLGNFQLMVIRLDREEINSMFLFKEPKPQNLAYVIRKYMDIMGLKRIYITNREETAKETIEELNTSGFVVLIADEFKRRGVEVNFFDQPTLMAAGPADFALKTGTMIVPIFSIRGKKSRYRIIIDEPIEYSPTGDTENDIKALTQMRTDILEKYVRKYPDQWLWIHSRWKKKYIRHENNS